MKIPAHVRFSATSQQEYVCAARQEQDESEYEGVPGHHVSCLGLVQLDQ